MLITAEKLSATIGEIYAAAGTSNGFNLALRQIRTLLNASSGMLFTPLLDPEKGGFGFVDHFNTEFFARYRAYYWDKDPWAREGARRGLMKTCNTVTDQALISQHDLQKEEIYPDLLVPMDTTRICCNVISVDDDATLPRTYLSLYRGVGSRPFKEEERRVLELLGPHVGQALRLSYRLNFAETSCQSAYDVLHEVDCGVVLIDAGKRVVFMNRSAEKACTQTRGLVAGGPWTSNGTLRATRQSDDVLLQRTIDCALRSSVSNVDALARTEAVAIHSPDGTGTLVATAIPLPANMGFASGLQAQIVIFLSDPACKRSADDRFLRALFGVTLAECRVARALLAGDQPKRIAEKFGLSENTVRTQIKALYAKTGTRGMAALIALLSRLAETRASIEHR